MRNQNSVLTVLALAAMIALLGAGPSAAQTSDDFESFRAELLAYVRGLQQLPDGMLRSMYREEVSLSRAESQIQALTPEELNLLRLQMEKIPYWRELPQILSSAAPGLSRDLGAAAEQAREVAGFNVEQMVRDQMLTMTAMLKQMPAEFVPPDYHQRVERVEAMILSLDREQLLTAQQMMHRRMPEWSQALQQQGSGPRAGLRMITLEDCSGKAFPDNLGCELNNIFADIKNIANKVAEFASAAVTTIKDSLLTFLKETVSAFPSTAAGLANHFIDAVGLRNPDWSQIANTIGANLRIPCPADGTVIPFYGETGKIETAVNFAGTIGFLGNMVAEIAPGDLLTSINLQAVAQIVNAPIQWLAGCLQNSYDGKYQLAQKNHRTLVTVMLNETVSSRASMDSITGATGAQQQVTNLDAAVVGLGKKVDELPDGQIEDSTVRTIAMTTVLTETSNRLDVTATRLNGKVSQLQTQQSKTTELLTDLHGMHIRLLIENDLFRNGTDKISPFQLPGSVGGLIEVVRSIVEETLASRAAARVNVNHALKDLKSAIAAYDAGSFKAAYEHFRMAYQKAIN